MPSTKRTVRFQKNPHRMPRLYSHLDLCELSLQTSCSVVAEALHQLYTSVLSVIALVSKTWSSAATRSNIITLLAVLFVYVYRDLWPLATYTQKPADDAEGGILWAKISILAVTAVFIPLFIPRRYIPVDPKVFPLPCFWQK